MGDVRRAATWWAAGGGTGTGGAQPQDFHDLLVGEQVGVLTETPSAAAVLPEEGLGSLALVVAGEACRRRWWIGGRRPGDAQRIRPTETTMCVAISAPLEPGAGAPPIGSPVPRRRCSSWITGCARCRRCGGELYVAGAGLASAIGGGPL
ncbi:putative pstA [Mycobacterium xenopi 3993]|nr:putative pstA [Mycobacterium xenopi 3993]